MEANWRPGDRRPALVSPGPWRPPSARPGRELAEGTRGLAWPGGEWPRRALLLFPGTLSALESASSPRHWAPGLGCALPGTPEVGARPGPGRLRDGHAQPAPVAWCGEKDLVDRPPPRGDVAHLWEDLM